MSKMDFDIETIRSLALEQRNSIRQTEREVRISIVEMGGEELENRNGEKYLKLIIKYVYIGKAKVYEKKTAIWTEEARMLVDNLEENKNYVVSQEKNDAGFWEWKQCVEIV